MKKIVLGILLVVLFGCGDKPREESGYKIFEQNMQAKGYDMHMKRNESGNYQWRTGNGIFLYLTDTGSYSFTAPRGIERTNKRIEVFVKNLAIRACYGMFLSALGFDNDRDHPELEATSNEVLFSAWDDDDNEIKQGSYHGAKLSAANFPTNPPVYRCMIAF
ncbi:hypothetical protein I6M49_22395 [Shewanella algae]|uniref:hypothetical protein n=1 Tax=Shewanella algae TaxID=38313 RepID=UPI001AAD7AFD|nr:hypothetical protein [Shewanella algae]MBO2656197.1 hypothetical protein [Shewanella algae]